MKPLKTVDAAIAIVLSAAFAGAHAQGMMDHSSMGGMNMRGMKGGSMAAGDMTGGEVRKVNQDNLRSRSSTGR